MDRSPSFDSQDFPDPRLFQLIAVRSRAFLSSFNARTFHTDSLVDSAGLLTPMANWHAQMATHDISAEQSVQTFCLQTSDLVSKPNAEASVSPSLGAHANYDFGVIQSQMSPIVHQIGQFAMTESPLIDATSGVFTTEPYSPLFSTSPLLPVTTTASGQDASESTLLLSPCEQPNPSDAVYNLPVDAESYQMYQSLGPSYLGRHMNDRPVQQLYPSQLYTPQPESPATVTFPFENGLLLFQPSPSYSPPPDARLPSPPKSVSGGESDLYMDTEDDEEENQTKPLRRKRVRKPSKPKEGLKQNPTLAFPCSVADCTVSCKSAPSLARHQATHQWKGIYHPLRCEACDSTLSNEYSVQRHISRSKPDSLCRRMRVYSFMKSKTEPRKTVRFYPKRAHGKKTAVVDLDSIRKRFNRLGCLQLE